jgi:arylsulfatase A-like enzyme
LGWDWQFINEPSAETEQFGKQVKYYQPHDIDWTKPVSGGPLSHGFDYYFGDGTINFPPYAWMENDRFLEIPTETMLESNIGFKTKEGNWEFRPGPKVKDWNPYDVLPTLTKKAVEWIKNRNANEPFFLYLPLPSPHAPIIPNDEFDNKSKAGAYGDFVFQTDWVAGQVLQALKEKGLDKNTIIIFSADNGTEQYAWKRAEKFGHFSMGNDRGLKQDVYEGGHHVPFIVKWPGQTKAGSISNEVISQIDVMATLANITGAVLPEKAAPDSYDITPVLVGKKYDSPIREATVHNTYKEIWGLRKGDWLFINNNTGSQRKMPESFIKLKGYTEFSTKGILFNMKEDPEQRVNLYENYPEKIKEMELMLQSYRASEKTVNR